jgi:PhnB protein
MINTYLLFDGKCEEAFKLYAQVLGGKIEAMLTFDSTPAAGGAPPGFGKKIMHALMRIGDQTLMASDCPPDKFDKPAGFSVNVTVKTPADAERVYTGLSAGGKITMPLSETFWAQKFGMFVDRFGIPWMVNCGKPR